MKQLLDTFGRWGFFALYAVLLFVAAFWIGVKIDSFFSPDEESESLSKYHGLEELSLADLVRVRDTFAMWHEMNEVTGRNRDDGQTLPAAEILKRADFPASEFEYETKYGNEHRILVAERKVRKTICETIDAIPGFRDSERFKELIEKYPTYKEKKQ